MRLRAFGAQHRKARRTAGLAKEGRARENLADRSNATATRLRAVWLFALLPALPLLGCPETRNLLAPKPFITTSLDAGDAGPPALRLGEAKEATVTPDLRAVGPQYFHPSAKEGFHVLEAGRTYFYDPLELSTRHPLPSGMYRFWRTVGDTWIGYGPDGLHLAARGDVTSRPVVGLPPYLGAADAVRSRVGDLWVALNDKPWMPSAMGLLHLTSSSTQVVLNPAGPHPRTSAGDLAVASLDDDRVALAWTEPTPTGLRAVVAWRDPSLGTWSTPQLVDEVTLTPAVAELSARTGLELTAIGLRDHVAIAWRPLLPDAGEAIDVGTSSAPPSRPARAELRIVSLDGTHAPTLARHKTWAMPLMGTSGVGPWPLQVSGLQGTRLGELAVFAWNDFPDGRNGAVLCEASERALPMTLRAGVFRFVFRQTPSGLDVFLFNPSEPIRSMSVDFR